MKSKKILFVNGFTYLAMVVIGLIMVFPFIWMFAASFKTGSDVYSLTLIPKHFTLENYQNVIKNTSFLQWFFNSFLITGISTLSVLVFDPLVGYTFNKFEFRGKEFIFLIILSTLMIPTEMMIIPWYLICAKLQWINTYWALLFPGLCSAFGVFLTRQFFHAVPNDLLDSGRIDGLTEFKIYYKIALPLIKPALSALVIFTFLFNWNSFLWPVIAMDDPDKYTITVGLAQFSNEARSAWELILTGASIATIPVLIIYIVFQNKIVEGIQLSGIKG